MAFRIRFSQSIDILSPDACCLQVAQREPEVEAGHPSRDGGSPKPFESKTRVQLVHLERLRAAMHRHRRDLLQVQCLCFAAVLCDAAPGPEQVSFCHEDVMLQWMHIAGQPHHILIHMCVLIMNISSRRWPSTMAALPSRSSWSWSTWNNGFSGSVCLPTNPHITEATMT